MAPRTFQEDSKWSLLRAGIAVFFVLVGVAGTILIPYIPIGLGLWFILISVFMTWPEADPTEPPTSLTNKIHGDPNADNARSYKRMLWSIFTFKVWTLTPFLTQQQQQNGEKVWIRNMRWNNWRPIYSPCTVGSFRAILVGFVFAGLDLMMTAYFQALHLPQLNLNNGLAEAFNTWMNPTFRPSWVPVISFFFGFAFTKVYSEDKRWVLHEASNRLERIDAVKMSCMVANEGSGIAEREGVGWKIMRSPMSILITLGVIGVGAILFFNPLFNSYEWLAGVGLFLLGVAMLTASIRLRPLNEQTVGWDEKINNIMSWIKVWEGNLGAKTPPPPFKGDPQSSNANQRGADEDKGKVMSGLFGVPAGKSISDYAKKDVIEKLSSSLQSQFVVIEPYANVHPRTIKPEEIAIPRPDIFYLTYLDPDAHTLTAEIFAENDGSGGEQQSVLRNAVVRLITSKAFQETLKWPLPIYRGGRIITTDESKFPMYETIWDLPSGLTMEAVRGARGKIKNYLPCDYFRIGERPGSKLSIVIGTSEDYELRDENTLKYLREIDWSYYMESAKLTTSEGLVPKLTSVRPGEGDSEVFHFDVPAEISIEEIESSVLLLQNFSEYQYIDVQKTKEENNRCALVASRIDPLSETYLFHDAEDEIIFPRVSGEERMDYSIGMSGTGKLMKQTWGVEISPHMLVAGASGGGKSEVINSILCQAIHNNHPDDLHLWLMEPKTELQAYQYLAHTKRFIADEVVENLLPCAAAILQEGVQEMKRRNRLMAEAGGIQDIRAARVIAKKNPDKYKKLLFPYIIIVLEECSTFFRQPPRTSPKEEKDAHAMIDAAVKTIAEKARAAGIFLLCATQNPVKESMNRHAKANSRIIGLKTLDATASDVVIGNTLLSEITVPGRGLAHTKSGTSGFKGLLLKSDKNINGEKMSIDSRQEVLSRVPLSPEWPKVPDVAVLTDTTNLNLPDFEEENKARNARYKEWLKNYEERMNTDNHDGEEYEGTETEDEDFDDSDFGPDDFSDESPEGDEFYDEDDYESDEEGDDGVEFE